MISYPLHVNAIPFNLTKHNKKISNIFFSSVSPASNLTLFLSNNEDKFSLVPGKGTLAKSAR
jgi:hypothetical protein